MIFICHFSIVLKMANFAKANKDGLYEMCGRCWVIKEGDFRN
jgi:hypothetical protein